jgi:hypothetical protein
MISERTRFTRLFAGAALACAASVPAAAEAPPLRATTGLTPTICVPIPCILPNAGGPPVRVLSYSWGSAGRTTSDPQEGGEVVKGVDSVKPPERATSDPQEGGEIVKGVDTMKAPEPSDPATAARKGKVKPAIGDMKFVRRSDKASPMMRSAPPPSGSLTLVVPAGACTAGARYPSLDLALEDGAYRLEEVVVTGCSPADKKTDDGKPAETLALNYGKISAEYGN